MSFRPVRHPNDPDWRATEGAHGSPEMLAHFVNPNKGEIVSPADGHSIPTEGLSIGSGATFQKGDLVSKNGSGEAVLANVAGGDGVWANGVWASGVWADNVWYGITASTVIYGVALESVANGASLGPASDVAIVAPVSYTDTQRTNKTYKIIFAVQDKDLATPVSGDIGTKCAINLSGGSFTIDIDDTATQDVEVVDIDAARKEYYVQFEDGIIQS